MSNNSGFTFRNGNNEVSTPAPSQSTWDTLLAVLTGAAIAVAAAWHKPIAKTRTKNNA